MSCLWEIAPPDVLHAYSSVGFRRMASLKEFPSVPSDITYYWRAVEPVVVTDGHHTYAADFESFCSQQHQRILSSHGHDGAAFTTGRSGRNDLQLAQTKLIPDDSYTGMKPGVLQQINVIARKGGGSALCVSHSGTPYGPADVFGHRTSDPTGVLYASEATADAENSQKLAALGFRCRVGISVAPLPEMTQAEQQEMGLAPSFRRDNDPMVIQLHGQRYFFTLDDMYDSLGFLASRIIAGETNAPLLTRLVLTDFLVHSRTDTDEHIQTARAQILQLLPKNKDSHCTEYQPTLTAVRDIAAADVIASYLYILQANLGIWDDHCCRFIKNKLSHGNAHSHNSTIGGELTDTVTLDRLHLWDNFLKDLNKYRSDFLSLLDKVADIMGLLGRNPVTFELFDRVGNLENETYHFYLPYAFEWPPGKFYLEQNLPRFRQMLGEYAPQIELPPYYA